MNPAARVVMIVLVLGNAGLVGCVVAAMFGVLGP